MNLVNMLMINCETEMEFLYGRMLTYVAELCKKKVRLICGLSGARLPVTSRSLNPDLPMAKLGNSSFKKVCL